VTKPPEQAHCEVKLPWSNAGADDANERILLWLVLPFVILALFSGVHHPKKLRKSKAIRVRSIWAVFAWAGFLVGCGDDSSDNRPGGNANVSGNWHAETTSSLGPTSFDFDFIIVQNGGSLASSTVFLSGTPCANDGTLTGRVDQHAVDLTITGSGGSDTITVNASTDGLTMTGTYTISGSCHGADNGSFSASALFRM